MAKPTKYATLICAVMTVFAALGILIGFITKNALVTMFALLPAVGYEAYRTEGVSTRFASWGMVVVYIAVLIFIIFRIDFDVAGFLGESSKYVGGYQVPLGDIKVVGAALMIVLSVILFLRTRGVYTRWLAAIIFVTSFAVVYLLAPDAFKELLRFGTTEVVNRVG